MRPADYRHTPGWITLWHGHARFLLANEAKFEAAFAGWTCAHTARGLEPTASRGLYQLGVAEAARLYTPTRERPPPPLWLSVAR